MGCIQRRKKTRMKNGGPAPVRKTGAGPLLASVRIEELLPFLKYPVHIVRIRARPEFALGDAAAVLPQRRVYLFDRLIDFCMRAVRQKMLPVDLSPEGDLSPKRSQVFDSHAEQLAVHRVQPQLDEPWDDAQDMSV